MKFLFLLVTLVAVFWIVRHLARPPARRRAPRAAERMIPCHRCGLHVPEGEVVRRNGHDYCSQAHADEDAPP